MSEDKVRFEVGMRVALAGITPQGVIESIDPEQDSGDGRVFPALYTVRFDDGTKTHTLARFMQPATTEQSPAVAGPVAPSGKLVEGLDRWRWRSVKAVNSDDYTLCEGWGVVCTGSRGKMDSTAIAHNAAIDAAFKAGAASRDAEVEAFRSNLHDVLRVLSCGDSELDEIKNSVKDQTLPSIRLTTAINYRSGMNARIKECKELRAKLAAMETVVEGEPGRWEADCYQVNCGDEEVFQTQFSRYADDAVAAYNAALDWWRGHHNRVVSELRERCAGYEAQLQKPWRAILQVGTEQYECVTVDTGYSDHALLVECPQAVAAAVAQEREAWNNAIPAIVARSYGYGSQHGHERTVEACWPDVPAREYVEYFGEVAGDMVTDGSLPELDAIRARSTGGQEGGANAR